MEMTTLFNTGSSAVFSECRTWRYALTRIWSYGKPMVAFIGLNPSTADEVKNDPTVRRCIGFAKLWGFGGMHMLNAFAFRATDPKDLKAATDPVGPDNDKWLKKIAKKVEFTIACWGNHGEFKNRGREVAALIPKLRCFRVTKERHPIHPLYLKRDLVHQPFAYERRQDAPEKR